MKDLTPKEGALWAASGNSAGKKKAPAPGGWTDAFAERVAQLAPAISDTASSVVHKSFAM